MFDCFKKSAAKPAAAVERPSVGSERAQAIEQYFATNKFVQDASDKIRQEILEGGSSWVICNPQIPGADRFGRYPVDKGYLEKVETALKEQFPAIDHLRLAFANSLYPTLVIDNKPNTWMRRTLSGPSYGGGTD